jgi:hypothetical protein
VRAEETLALADVADRPAAEALGQRVAQALRAGGAQGV